MDINPGWDLSNIPEENKNGNCFVVAFNEVVHNPDMGYKLVHGIVTGQGAIQGLQYCHAWVEKDGKVIDKTLPTHMQEFPLEFYYAIGNIKKVKKYTYKQTLENACKYETYGPWDPMFGGYW